MPTVASVIERLVPQLRHNLRALSAFGVDASEQNAAGVVAAALHQLRHGCGCAEHAAPPERFRESYFWDAVNRCETCHGATVGDLVCSGVMTTGTAMTRTFPHGRVTAAIGGEGCGATVTLIGDNVAHAMMHEVFRRHLTHTFPASSAYTDDARFWRWQQPDGTWPVLGTTRLRRLRDEGTTLPIRGHYLGVRVEGTLRMTDGEFEMTVPVVRPEPFDNPLEAARAVREFVMTQYRPHAPRHGWQSGPDTVPLDRFHTDFWDHVFTPEYGEPNWVAYGCHAVSLDEFLRRAVVGGRMPGAAGTREFTRGISFLNADLTDDAGRPFTAGDVLLCSGCGRQATEPLCRHCRRYGEAPAARTALHIFPVGTREEWSAWRCNACMHHWCAADPSPTCPRCDSATLGGPLTVWRAVGTVPLADDA